MQLGNLVLLQCFPAYDEKLESPKYYLFNSHDSHMCLRHNQMSRFLKSFMSLKRRGNIKTSKLEDIWFSVDRDDTMENCSFVRACVRACIHGIGKCLKLATVFLPAVLMA